VRQAELLRHTFGMSPGRTEEMLEIPEIKSFLDVRHTNT
jgi:hypothetical protein